MIPVVGQNFRAEKKSGNLDNRSNRSVPIGANLSDFLFVHRPHALPWRRADLERSPDNRATAKVLKRHTKLWHRLKNKVSHSRAGL